MKDVLRLIAVLAIASVVLGICMWRTGFGLAVRHDVGAAVYAQGRLLCWKPHPAAAQTGRAGPLTLCAGPLDGRGGRDHPPRLIDAAT